MTSQPQTPWCQPMDNGKSTPRKFMIYFDDPDHGIMVFDNEAEARAAFEQKNTAWNCYLFGTLPRLSDECVAVPKAALDWLDGSAPDADGKWFGESAPNPDEKPYRKYWWRSKFRSMIPAPAVSRRPPSDESAEVRKINELHAENERLKALISRPYVGAWTDEILIEAAHQRERWGSGHDHGKAPEDWFWLIGYLAGKCLASHKSGDTEKAHHHTVSTAAVLVHWAAAIDGSESVFRPGLGAEALYSRIGCPNCHNANKYGDYEGARHDP